MCFSFLFHILSIPLFLFLYNKGVVFFIVDFGKYREGGHCLL